MPVPGLNSKLWAEQRLQESQEWGSGMDGGSGHCDEESLFLAQGGKANNLCLIPSPPPITSLDRAHQQKGN